MSYKVFKGVYKNFKEEGGDLSFFNSDIFFEKKSEKLRVDLELGEPSYSYILTPLVLGLSKNKEIQNFKILDYGGGLGGSFVDLERSIDDLRNIHYVIYDSERNCKMGRKFLSNKSHLEFFSDINCLNFSYNLMHLGSVIQYVEDIRKEFSQLFEVNGERKPKHILMSDTYVGSSQSYVTRCDYYGYKHPFKVRSWNDLLDDMSFFSYKLKAKIAFISKIGDKHEFYDMSNIPEQLRLNNTWHLLFELKG